MKDYNINHSEIQYVELKGAAISLWENAIAELRIEIFKDWPYLYDGNIDYEKKYLSRYTSAIHSFFTLAFYHNELIGATSCIQLAEESDPEIIKPFITHQLDPNKIVYYGESLVKQKYRGHGIGSEFMRRRELFARSLKSELVAFCSVIRPRTHSMCPANYTPLDQFWERQGFKKEKTMICTLSWKDINQKNETKKELQFWLKPLSYQIDS